MPNLDIYPISKQELRKLYFKNKLSMFQIAEKLGCTHSAVVYKFKKFELESRGNLGLTKPIKLTKNGFEYLYYKKRLSLKKISKIVHCSESGLERKFKKYEMISRGNKNRASKYKKNDFSGDLTEKAYLIGFRLGDLNIMKRVSVIQVRCSTTIYSQVKLIKNLFSKYTTPHVWKAKRGTYEIVCLVNRSFNFLSLKEDRIPDWIQKNKKLFFSFLGGYSDAEGSFLIHRGKTKKGMGFGIYEIGSQQKNIIIQIWQNLNKLGITLPNPKINKKAGYIQSNGIKNNKDFWKISTGKRNTLSKLLNNIKIYIKHPNKITEIKDIEKINPKISSIPYQLA